MAPITPDTLYTKTAKGLLEISNKTVRLSRELGLVFFSIDGKAKVGELLPRSGMSAAQLHHALNTLVTDGYIKVVSHPGQHAPGAARVGDVDFTPPQALTSVNIEAASRALAAEDAVKRVQAEARAALDARMRQESEARARAQAAALERTSAEQAERAAADERARAEIQARDASDPLARAEAEARARAAAAAAVRAHAEAQARAEAEQRANALVDTKRAAEEEARREAEALTHAEQQAQARAAAERHAREVLEAQVQAMRGVRALADDPQAGEAEAARARVSELEAEAERAREAARGLAEAEGLAGEVPQPEMDITERVRQLNVRVQASRGSREAAERQARDAVVVDSQGKPATPDPNPSWPSLGLDDRTPPAKPAPSFAGTTQPDLPVIDLDRAEFDHKQKTDHGPGHHAPSALERAMALMTARKHLESKREPAPVQAAAPLPVTEGPPEPRAQAEPAGKIEPTLDDEPLHEKLNIDRAAHDVIAEGAEARRKAATQQLSRAVMDARRKRMEDDARRTAAEDARQRRKKARWIAGAALVIVPTAAIAWLQSATLNGYIPDAQRALSLRLNQPVTIAKLRYVLLPTPRLVLEGVTVGDGPGISVERVDAHVRPLAALAGSRHFDTVDVHGATVDAAMLGTIPAWTGGRTADAVHVDRLRLTAAKLVMPGRDLGAFDGNVAFESNGTLKQAVFTSPNAKLELTPRA